MNRKDEHVNLALKQYDDNRVNDFDEIEIIHHSLVAIDVDKVSLKTALNTLDLKYPFFINAMTGGSEFTKDINKKLAQVAKECDLAMAVGSLSPVLKDISSFETFNIVREVNPNGKLFANFNPNYTSQQILEISKKLRADAIQIHINSAQEIVMAEGDRVFKHWPKTISDVASVFDNLIVKEVGFGMSKETIEKLKSLNVKIVDISGTGGTNFVKIESSRNNNKMAYLSNWGLSTTKSLLEAKGVKNVDIIASGGIRNPLDMIKAFTLGAKAIGISGLILNSVINDGVEKTILLVEEFKEELRLIMALMGAKNISELATKDIVYSEKLVSYINQRKIKVD